MRRLAIALVVFLAGGPASAASWPTDEGRVALLLASDSPAARIEGLQRLRALPRATALPMVAKALEDEDVEVKLAAADAAMSMRPPEAPARAVPWLSDQDVRIRLAACRLLARMPSREALAPLGRALGDADQRVRQAAAVALGNARTGDAVPLLLGRLDDAIPETRAAVVLALRKLGDPRAAAPLLSRVQDGSPDVRKAVLRTLAELGGASASAAISVGLRDALPEVRIEALASLARVGDPDIDLLVTPLLTADQPREVRRAALSALASTGTPRALDALFSAFSADEAMRPAIRAALVASAPKLRAELTKRLEAAPAGPVASLLVEALGATRDPSAAAAVVAALSRGKVSVQPALSALASLGDSAGLLTALSHLEHKSDAVRRAARAASRSILEHEPSGRAVDPVMAALARPDLSLGEEIELVELLGRSGSTRAVAPLVDRARVGHPARRRASIDALAAIADPAAEDALFALLSDPEAELRVRAGLALGRSAGPKAAARLVDALITRAEQDREALALALPGALAKSTDEATFESLRRALASLDGGMRDAAIEGAGRSPTTGAESLLLGLASSSSIADRRKVAESLGASANGRVALAKLAGDSDEGVRANAVWSLGLVAADAELAVVRAALDDPSDVVASNAAVALARSLRRLSAVSDATVAPLCKAGGAARDRVASAAFVGLALVSARCGDGDVERRALAESEASSVRAAAALAISAHAAGPQDASALARCRRDDPVGAVARACQTSVPASAGTDAVSVVVLRGVASAVTPGAPFSLELADGSVRHGFADRRGMVFERAAPRGVLKLVEPMVGAPR